MNAFSCKDAHLVPFNTQFCCDKCYEYFKCPLSAEFPFNCFFFFRGVLKNYIVIKIVFVLLLVLIVIFIVIFTTESDRAVCGNRIVDEGEECDCGYTDQCTDKCCTARVPDKSMEDRENMYACKLKQSSQCRLVFKL